MGFLNTKPVACNVLSSNPLRITQTASPCPCFSLAGANSLGMPIFLSSWRMFVDTALGSSY
jgi:hypothetical protein